MSEVTLHVNGLTSPPLKLKVQVSSECEKKEPTLVESIDNCVYREIF